MLRRIFETKRDKTAVKNGENHTQSSSLICTFRLVVPLIVQQHW